jgi:hypothetical protein
MFYITRQIKIMLDVFKLEYKEIEDNLTNWKWKKMLKEMVTKDIMPFQMHKLYSNFGIFAINMWLNLSFN